MKNNTSILSDKSLILLFAYAPAGFGHLRVTDALYHGLPKNVTPFLLGSQDTSITFVHRLMSMHPIISTIVRWAEEGWGEDVFTFLYRLFLKSHTKLLYAQITTILSERIEVPKTLLIVATHFGLAHQLGAIKQQLVKDKKINILLVVQVTDDNPHHIWYIEEADIIFVPSEKTKTELLKYGKSTKLKKVPIEVSAYPIAPIFGMELKVKKIHNRTQQVRLESSSTIHVSVPVSGAAVGIRFITKIMDLLNKKTNRFLFHVAVKSTSYTNRFIKEMKKRPYVVLHTAIHDREVVDLYEQLYVQNVISLEITKPSEQAFKALCDYGKVGASILLFSEPIGKQEYDNLDFLRRHNLIPSKKENTLLLKKFFMNEKLQYDNTIKQSFSWRGIELPKGSKLASEFIWWNLKNGMFNNMIHCKVRPSNDDPNGHELHNNGVDEFWKKVSEMVKTKMY